MYATAVAQDATRVTWHAHAQVPLLVQRNYATVDQYIHWVASGHYSGALPDGSLLQITYDVHGGEITGHRLAYVPCPVIVDERLLRDGEPIADVVEVYLDEQASSVVALRSPIRFEFDPVSARPGHPASHLTINGADCRIACVAPMHPYRFIDFVYRHFYPELRAAQMEWFGEAERRMLGSRMLTEDDRAIPHVVWRLHHL
jgi:hypothetical protein